jgi:hypothetical protein
MCNRYTTSTQTGHLYTFIDCYVDWKRNKEIVYHIGIHMKRQRKTTTNFRLGGVLADIRTENLPNINLQRYRYSNLLVLSHCWNYVDVSIILISLAGLLVVRLSIIRPSNTNVCNLCLNKHRMFRPESATLSEVYPHGLQLQNLLKFIFKIM